MSLINTYSKLTVETLNKINVFKIFQLQLCLSICGLLVDTRHLLITVKTLNRSLQLGNSLILIHFNVISRLFKGGLSAWMTK